MSGIKVNKRKNEPASGMLYRFSKRMKQSGVLKEFRRRQFRKRTPNKRKIQLSAKYRREKTLEVMREGKMGFFKKGK